MFRKEGNSVMKPVFTVAVLMVMLTGCSSKVNNKHSVAEKTPQGLYSEASKLLKRGNYSDAADLFNEVESLFPYSSRAARSQIMAAYCHFRAENYVDATRELDIFARYHASNKLMPYALYLRAMCVYMQISSVGRNAKIALDAKQAFVELLNKFPDSIYAKDCVKKIRAIDGTLAAREMMVGRFYQKAGNSLSALGRYNFVINNFGHTNQVPEAYYRIIECCCAEGMELEAAGTYDILKRDYSSSKWTKKAADLLGKGSKGIHAGDKSGILPIGTKNKTKRKKV